MHSSTYFHKVLKANHRDACRPHNLQKLEVFSGNIARMSIIFTTLFMPLPCPPSLKKSTPIQDSMDRLKSDKLFWPSVCLRPQLTPVFRPIANVDYSQALTLLATAQAVLKTKQARLHTLYKGKRPYNFESSAMKRGPKLSRSNIWT